MTKREELLQKLLSRIGHIVFEDPGVQEILDLLPDAGLKPAACINIQLFDAGAGASVSEPQSVDVKVNDANFLRSLRIDPGPEGL